MSSRNDFVLRRAPVGAMPDCSLAEYLLPKLRSLPKDHVIQIDADTGAVQTVAELLETTIRLSEGLKNLGLRENDVVALLSRNCFEAGAVVLASWLSAVAVSPTAVNVKTVELKHVFEVAPPKFVFCEEQALSTVESVASLLSTPPTVILIDSTKDSCRHQLTLQDVLVEVDTDRYRPSGVSSPETQLVGILFSSGTSGLPKGVGITHRNLIFQDMNMEGLVPEELKTCLQISGYFWVTGVLMFLKSLTTGVCRVLLREPTIGNLLRAIERYRTSWTLMSPALALSIIDSPEFERFDVSSMKKILVGGSPLIPAVTDRIREKWSTVQLTHTYGATESSGSVTCTYEEKDVTPVGRVMPGVEMKFVDRNTGKAVKSGTLGEICVRSLGIMRGYVGNEEKTREVIDAEGWYHTGDLGYYDDSGQIFIVDRIKEMLKVMNLQVAPAELENTILEVPGVAEAAVAGVAPDGNTTLIMALVVKSKDSTVTEDDIQAHVAATLSDYKSLTAGVHFVDSIPKTNNGKLGRKEIKEIAQALYSATSG